MVNPEIGSALIGAGVAAVAMMINHLVATAKIQATQEEHKEKFKGVDILFAGLDQRFVPRREIDARLTALKESQDRIEKMLNLVFSLGRSTNINFEGKER
jgi:hypothetical protein